MESHVVIDIDGALSAPPDMAALKISPSSATHQPPPGNNSQNMQKQEENSDFEDEQMETGEEFAVDEPSWPPVVLTQEEFEKKARLETRNIVKSDAGKILDTDVTDYKFVYVPQVCNFDCKDYRWVYLEQGAHIPFNGKDSYKIEIKYRVNNSLLLDDAAQHIRDTKMKHINFSTAQSDKDIIEKGKVLVLNKCYKVSGDNKRIDSVHWKNDSKDISRGLLFTMDGKPVPSEVSDKIERHLTNFQQKLEYNALENQNAGKYPNPDALEINFDNKKILIEWSSLIEFTIRRENEHPQDLVRHFEEANWKDREAKVEHLVFVIHGVDHDEKEHLVVNSTKQLNENVEKIKKNSGILFLPIHWRTGLEAFDPLEHVCDAECEKEIVSRFVEFDSRLNDVVLYACTARKILIKEMVIAELNAQYAKFVENRPNFSGSVSFFAHSLGSVIGYDIMMDEMKSTKKSLNFQVKRVFNVGSPLRKFLEVRGDGAVDDFLLAVDRMKIYNIFHPTDIISDRVEPHGNPSYSEVLPVQIPAIHPQSNLPYKTVVRIGKTLKNSADWISNSTNRKSLLRRHVTLEQMGSSERYASRIDHQLADNEKWGELNSHSIYWNHEGVCRFVVHNLSRRDLKFSELKVSVPPRQPLQNVGSSETDSAAIQMTLVNIHTSKNKTKNNELSEDDIPTVIVKKD